MPAQPMARVCVCACLCPVCSSSSTGEEANCKRTHHSLTEVVGTCTHMHTCRGIKTLDLPDLDDDQNGAGPSCSCGLGDMDSIAYSALHTLHGNNAPCMPNRVWRCLYRHTYTHTFKNSIHLHPYIHTPMHTQHHNKHCMTN